MKREQSKIRYVLLTCLIGIVLLGGTNFITYSFVLKQQKAYYQEQFASYLKNEEEKNKLDVMKVENSIVEQSSFRIDENKVKDIKNVMIVAHPDDETLWGGAHIAEGGWLIICLTNGDNAVRNKEFFQVMKETGNYGIMLKYPDLTKHQKDNWSTVKEQITKDIRYIVRYKDWDQIVTHNPLGEYGHIQHLMTNLIVTNVCVQENKTDHLYYFEKFRKQQYVVSHNMKATINDNQIQQKHLLMQKYYPSQGKAYGLFQHMIPFEKFISYKDWTFE